MHITSRLSLLALAALGPASAQTCAAGSYRCSSASGQGALFYQCDVGGTEVQKTCAPGTVCYTQGSTILCSYPVTGAVQPASAGLAVGAACSFASPYDEYMCPGDNAQHDYYLRCLSGNYVSFPCPPGTACVKNEGQNMFCGWKSQAGGSGAAAASSAVLPSVPPVQVSAGGSVGGPSSDSSIESSTGSSVESSMGVSIELSASIGIGGASSAVFETSTSIGMPWDETTTASSSSESSPTSGSSLSESSSSSSSTHGLFSDEPPLFPTTSSGFLISM
ncbi:hypothetical protein IW150_003293, partial [Coemansia sp. RSA 2607]